MPKLNITIMYCDHALPSVKLQDLHVSFGEIWQCICIFCDIYFVNNKHKYYILLQDKTSS